jgi:hypothetical protein
MVSGQYISKIKSVSRSASDNSQMVIDLISLRNRIGTIRRRPQLTKCNGRNERTHVKDDF